MVDLIRALIQVKTPLSLFAFLSLVFLVAFRTKRVPELFFGLAKDKLTRERFAQLLHRFMVFGFSGFVLVCGVALLGQVLAYKAQARPVPLDDLRNELKNLNATEESRQAALEAYAAGLADLSQHNVAQAIQSLQQSVDAVPTIAAQTTLALLYQTQGDHEKASQYKTAALTAANLRGDTLAQVRLQTISESPSASTQGSTAADMSMIGSKKPFPEGGPSFEKAEPISPGLYITTHDLGGRNWQYYRIRLPAGHTVRVAVRSPAGGGSSCASIYDSDGVIQQNTCVYLGNALGSIQWTPTVEGPVYLSIGGGYGNSADSVYRISVQ